MKNLLKVIHQIKYNNLISSLFALLATWVIFAAMPYFRLNGLYPQVDTQIIFLHFLSASMAIYLAIRVFFFKYELKNLNHPFVLIPFFLALFGLIASFLGKNLNSSLSGSPQIGQGVFWYFDLTIMSIVFSQITTFKKIRLSIFINLVILTAVVTFFSFFPNWKGIKVYFYTFTDYLCFYGVLIFILFTTLTKKQYMHILAFFILGAYLSVLENRAANLFWLTTFLAGILYYILNFFQNFDAVNKIKRFLFSNVMFIFVILLISFLILYSSIYFWSENYSLPSNIKGSILDAPIVRGKIIETSLYSLNSIKSLIIGNGWGVVPDLLLENMKSWHHDELRLGYNLHFHTHNGIAEHTVSMGLIGAFLFLFYIYFIFKESEKHNMASKFGWLLFFKINCFWFLWTGTFSIFAVVLSCFFKNKEGLKSGFLNVDINKDIIRNKIIFSLFSIVIGVFLFYGAYSTYKATKVNFLLDYTAIVQHIENKKNTADKECLSFYKDFNRGGYMLDRFLSGYASYVLTLPEDDMDDQMLDVLNELQCKANTIIESNSFTTSLLATAMRVDSDYQNVFGGSKERRYILEKNYNDWHSKAIKVAKTMPSRGDLLLPFLSYAVNNDKSKDAVELCEYKVIGIESFCYLIKANDILADADLNQSKLKTSIDLIKKSVDSGLFNELVHGFWYDKCYPKEKKIIFCGRGLKGIPLSPDVIFMISDAEKQKIEKILNQSM